MITKYRIVKLLEKYKENCNRYIKEYCDELICSECALLNKYLYTEHCKIFNECNKCRGAGIIDMWEDYISTTKTCNNCGGTGKYNPYTMGE
jgi:DnaJ-class molecular chaperone